MQEILLLAKNHSFMLICEDYEKNNKKTTKKSVAN